MHEQTQESWATIAIGRNQGNGSTQPLPDDQWWTFAQAVEALFSRPEFTFIGQSVSVEHGTEASIIIGGTLARPEHVRSELATLARRYRQTAISLTLGGSERITPTPQHETHRHEPARVFCSCGCGASQPAGRCECGKRASFEVEA